MKHLHSYDKLFEGKQVGTVYHYTSMLKLPMILRSNTLVGARHTKFVSLTRNSFFHTQPGYAVHVQVRLILDGDKISQRHSIRPHADTSDGVYLEEGSPTWKGAPENLDSGYIEFEERVDGSIPNLRKYIMGIQVCENIFLNRTVQGTIAEIEEEFGYKVGEFHHNVSDQY